MNVSKYLPLTETTFYILVSLLQPGHGYYVMQRAEELSNGKVRIAAGTMYGATQNLLKQHLIQAVPGNDARRKMYQTTPLGVEVLKSEAERIRYMSRIAEQFHL